MRDSSVAMEIKSGRAIKSIRRRVETWKGKTKIGGGTHLGNLELSMGE